MRKIRLKVDVIAFAAKQLHCTHKTWDEQLTAMGYDPAAVDQTALTHSIQYGYVRRCPQCNIWLSTVREYYGNGCFDCGWVHPTGARHA
jgi:hypothetical protein